MSEAFSVSTVLRRTSAAQRIAGLTAAILAVAFLIFRIGIDSPSTLVFDENIYVPIVREYVESGVLKNREHPPLAKELMAIGFVVAGDNPVGWRLMSAVFGALTLAGIFAWSFALFRREGAALWATLVTFANQLLFVEARIAMLDVFLVAFVVWALVPFTASWHAALSRHVRFLFLSTGALLGLASACKWTGAVAWLVCIGIVAAVKLLQSWNVRFEDARSGDWYREDLWREMSAWDWIESLGIVPLATYFLTFVIAFGPRMSLASFIDFQVNAYEGLSTIPFNGHPMASSPMEWPLIGHPIWYYQSEWTQVKEGYAARAVMLIGNPLVIWGGLLAIFACAYGWIKERRWNALIILAMYLGLYLCWIRVPHETFYFYYFPPAMLLGPALAYVFFETSWARVVWSRRLFMVATVLVFIFFLPISSAAIGLGLPDYYRAMWLSNWKW